MWSAIKLVIGMGLMWVPLGFAVHLVTIVAGGLHAVTGWGAPAILVHLLAIAALAWRWSDDLFTNPADQWSQWFRFLVFWSNLLLWAFVNFEFWARTRRLTITHLAERLTDASPKAAPQPER